MKRLFCATAVFAFLFINAFAIHEEPREQLSKRDDYIGLWNGTGPVYTDVKQVDVLNCWFAASTLAVLLSSQIWVEGMIRYGNGASMVNVSWPQDGTVQVQLWNPYTLEPVIETAAAADKSTTEDHPDGNWWHDAISQALRSLGRDVQFEGVFTNGTWDPTSGSAAIGLKILTGYNTTSNLTSDYADADAFWEDIARANQSTPVIFNTVDLDQLGVTTPQLGDSHDYAVFNGSILANGTKTIWARNSWGATNEFQLEDVYANTYQVIHLTDWTPLVWKDNSYLFTDDTR